ncbi:MAG: hypothetical protein OEN20_12035 [Gammaproteobacteria bacterium]|nr:hypothetical protein [Gammaproteobacteria bacterium]
MQHVVPRFFVAAVSAARGDPISSSSCIRAARQRMEAVPQIVSESRPADYQ